MSGGTDDAMIHSGRIEELRTLIDAAPRALVFLTVPWSASERRARRTFLAAAARLANEDARPTVACFAVEEDEGDVAGWLASAGSSLQPPMGAGTLLWLERGRQRAVVPAGEWATVESILEQCAWLWGGRAP